MKLIKTFEVTRKWNMCTCMRASCICDHPEQEEQKFGVRYEDDNGRKINREFRSEKDREFFMKSYSLTD